MSIQAAGYVGAALIAASAAFVGLVLGKEQKTTEFRQAWINDQREDLAILMSAARAAASEIGKSSERHKALRDFDVAHGRVLLRENPDTAEWHFVLAELERLRRYAFDTPLPKNVERGCEQVVALSRVLLKTEWNRVRRGETWFVAAKRVLPPAILLVAVALAYGKGFIVVGG